MKALSVPHARRVRRILLCVVLVTVAGTTGRAAAFSIEGSKWPPGVGLPSPGAVSFSVMPAGLNMTGDVGGHGHSPDLANSTNFNALISLGANQNEVNHVLAATNTWAAAAQLSILGVVADNGALYNSAPADPRMLAGPFGDIRLAATGIGGTGELAHAHLPPGSTLFGAATPNVSAPGDVHFNNTITWSDDPADSLFDADIDFQTTALHELGHSLGLLHSAVPGSVMYPAYVGGNRTLSADDIAGFQGIYGPQGIEPCIPPPSVYAADQHSYPGFNINNPRHMGFQQCAPLPLGGSSTESFSSIFEADVSAALIGGDPSDVVHVVSFADVGVDVTFNSILGNLEIYDLNMTQLDISGGSDPGAILYEGILLPPNMLIRQDPDRPTLGRIELNQTTLQMDSFFDVFTELSIDGGQTWVDSIGSTHMATSFTFVPEPATLGLLLIGGILGLARRAR